VDYIRSSIRYLDVAANVVTSHHNCSRLMLWALKWNDPTHKKKEKKEKEKKKMM